MNTKFNVNILGLKVSEVGFLIVEDTKEVLYKKHQTKLQLTGI